MQRHLDLFVSAFLLLAAMALFAMTFTDQFDVPTFGGDVGPAFAPRGFLAVWAFLALAATIQALRNPAGETRRLKSTQMLSVVIVVAGTGFAMTKIGFLLAMVPGLFLFCWAFGYRKIAILLAISVFAPLFIWALFTFGFELRLPQSPWFNRV